MTRDGMSGFSPSAGRNSNILSFSFIIENKTSLRRSSGLEMNNKNGVDRNFFFFFLFVGLIFPVVQGFTYGDDINNPIMKNGSREKSTRGREENTRAPSSPSLLTGRRAPASSCVKEKMEKKELYLTWSDANGTERHCFIQRPFLHTL